MAEKNVNPGELINRDYEKFIEELSQLLTFVPEGQRRTLIESFILGVLRS